MSKYLSINAKAYSSKPTIIIVQSQTQVVSRTISLDQCECVVRTTYRLTPQSPMKYFHNCCVLCAVRSWLTESNGVAPSCFTLFRWLFSSPDASLLEPENSFKRLFTTSSYSVSWVRKHVRKKQKKKKKRKKKKKLERTVMTTS